MSIVIITIPGQAKRSIVQRIQNASDGQVALVIVQKPRPQSLRTTLHRWYNAPDRIANLYYGAKLRYQPKLRSYLDYFRARSHSAVSEWSAPVIETDNINHPDIVSKVRAIAPKVLAVWGSTIICKDLTSLPEHAINLHMGCSPHYRGAVANQRAVERQDYDRIGFTLHYINGKVDAGNIITQQCGVPAASLLDTFTTLNDHAETALVETTVALASGHSISTTPQDLTIGENVRLREWDPKMRYRVAQLLRRWEIDGAPPQQ